MVWVYIYSSICFVIYGKVAQWWVGGYEGLFGLGFESCALQVKIWIFFIWVFTGQPQKIGDFLLKNWCLNSKTGVFFFIVSSVSWQKPIYCRDIGETHQFFFGNFTLLTFRHPILFPRPPKCNISTKFHWKFWKFSFLVVVLLSRKS